MIPSWFGIRTLGAFVLLVAGWCALWGEVSVANVASGALVAVVALALGASGTGRGGVRVVPLLRLVRLVLVDLVASTVAVIREVLTPTDHTAEAIVAVELPEGSDRHLLLLYLAITITPGTAVVGASPDASAVYLHVLHRDRSQAITAHVLDLVRTADAALPAAPPKPGMAPTSASRTGGGGS